MGDPGAGARRPDGRTGQREDHPPGGTHRWSPARRSGRGAHHLGGRPGLVERRAGPSPHAARRARRHVPRGGRRRRRRDTRGSRAVRTNHPTGDRRKSPHQGAGADRWIGGQSTAPPGPRPGRARHLDRRRVAQHVAVVAETSFDPTAATATHRCMGDGADRSADRHPPPDPLSRRLRAEHAPAAGSRFRGCGERGRWSGPRPRRLLVRSTRRRLPRRAADRAVLDQLRRGRARPRDVRRCRRDGRDARRSCGETLTGVVACARRGRRTRSRRGDAGG